MLKNYHTIVMTQNYHISQKGGMARVLIIILWQRTLPQHDDHQVLTARTYYMNTNNQS